MKRIITLILLLGGFAFGLQAQILRTVPSGVVRSLPDGWHKFVSQGATFDVEISEGSLVKGNITWLDNSTYSGSFSRNAISGKGTYTWPNGDRYEGSFKANERSGKGTMYWKNGEKYGGKWKLDKKHGKGKMWNAAGEIVDEGVWEDNVLVKKAKKKKK